MDMLHVDGQRPTIILRANLGSRWLGRCTFRNSTPPVHMIEIQKRILADPKTLERVVAHEVVHHVNNLQLLPHALAMLKLGVQPPHHGEDFWKLAKAVNEKMGGNFVTVTSDEEYVEALNQKEFFLYIEPAVYGPGKLGYAWAVKISEKALKRWRNRLDSGGKIFRTTDVRWTNCKAKISTDYKGLCFPRKEEDQILLREIYEGSPSIL